MTIDEFRSLQAGAPPAGLPGALLALLQDLRGDWEAAHESAQGDGTRAGDWVHGYLHRKEGDLGNAAYWYRRAGRTVPACTPAAEWEQIAAELLAAG
jgi:hypothetical protein